MENKPIVIGGFRVESPILIDRAKSIASRDVQYFKHEVYEMIGEPGCYVPQELLELSKLFAPEDKTIRTDVMLFGDVKPHIDEVDDETYLVHMVCHGTGTFCSDGEEIPVRPGMVFAMNPRVEHSFKTDQNIMTLCMEKRHGI